MNEAMRIERAHDLKVDPYERSAGRRSHANGFKPKTFSNRLGKLQLPIPQTRESQFYPSTLERGERSKSALKLALAEMVVQGVSTRKRCSNHKRDSADWTSPVPRSVEPLSCSTRNWMPGGTASWTRVQYLVVDAQIRKSPSRRHCQRLCRTSGHRHSSGWPSKRTGSQLLVERSGSPLAILPGKPAHSWHERGSVHRQ